MAKRRGSRGSNAYAVVLIVVIGIIASIPPAWWIIIAVVAALMFIVSQVSRSGTPNSPEDPNPTTRRGRQPEIVVSFETGPSRSFQSQPQALKGPAVPARWVAASETIEVAGFKISGGMLYFGSNLPTNGYSPEPALIEPRLPVAAGPVDIAQRLMTYWPSYSQISLEARRAYLQWLASGRRAPEADTGYVFLFFYGLERRLLLDARTDPIAQAEQPAIEAEIRRLLAIYQSNNSFRGYATRFLDFLAARNAPGKAGEQPPPASSYREMTLPLKMSLGRMAAAGRAVPPDWALAWVKADPAISSPKPIQRCPNEFDKLFRDRYRQQFGDGIRLPVNRTKLKVSYRPASAGFGQEYATEMGDIPDVTAVVAPAKKMQALVDECAEALSPYSRFVGRNPSNAASLEGLLLLPQTLWPESAQVVTRELNRRIGDGMTSITLGDLATSLGGSGPLTRDRVKALANSLAELHVGIEPDVLAGARSPKADDALVLFRTLPGDGARGDTPAYNAAAVTLDLACGVAMADGEASASELRLLMKQVESWADLSDAQRKRLRARMRLGIAAPPTLQSLKKKFETIPGEARRAIAHLLSTVAQADGTVAATEVKFIEKAYKALGIDPQLVYGDLHIAASRSSTVAKATPGAERTAPGISTSGAFVLDAARIEALQKETEQVSALLTKVFADDAPPPVEQEELEDSKAAPDPGLLGLDPEHAAFLRLLMSRASWQRQELADAAADMELMLDGALERINEAALDRFEEPLIEGDDPVEIQRGVMEKISA